MSLPRDRAAAVRAALRELVAEHGFHGVSMSAVARRAGVATGTAYTHYESKDVLVLAACAETKSHLGRAVTEQVPEGLGPADRFVSIWLAAYRHLIANPSDARFLVQFDSSPYRARGHRAPGQEDPLLVQAAAPDLAGRLLALPLEVLYELGLAPAIRLAGSGETLEDTQLEVIARACWRAISRGDVRRGRTAAVARAEGVRR